MDAADVVTSGTAARAAGELGERDCEILGFERQWWQFAGAKEQAVRDKFGMSATRYYQVLNTLIDDPAALAFDPLLVKRLRRLRLARQRSPLGPPAGPRPVTPAPRRDERGLVLPSWLVAVCGVVVALAVVGFAVSGDRDPEVAADAAGPPADGSTARGAGGSGNDGGGQTGPGGDAEKAADPDRDARRGPRDDEPAEPRTAYVEVYNNSGITGLAAGTTATLQDTGWRVVTTDNWYGEIPSTTVYHPAALAGQARLLAGDLGVERVRPAVEPMSFDRLTVILVSGA